VPARIIDGRAVASELRAELLERSSALRETGVAPSLAIVLVGEDDSSRAYVQTLARTGERVGVSVSIEELDASASAAQVREQLEKLGNDSGVHGVMLQQPLPPHLSIRTIGEAIPPRKDVDGAHPYNQGLLVAGETFLVHATAAAVMELLHQPGVPSLDGARAVVLGRSAVVGRPVALLLIAENATVTVCHSHTKGLPEITRRADILVAAVGKPHFVTAQMVKGGATVIDVGTNYLNGHFVGDVDYDAILPVAGLLTPVPGGVGPVTTAVLLRSVVEAAERSR